MTEIIIAVAGKVSEYLVAPIGRQLGYLFCYRRYTDELRNKVQTLGTARDDLHITVEEARRRGDQIRPIVQDWLDRVDQITGEAEELLNDENNKSCFHLKSRYQLGREAYKKAQVIVGIQTARDFPDGISYSVPPRAATFKGYECFESRDSTLNQIMIALRDEDDEMNIIGVWGMGGVGKTTLVKEVAERAKQEKLFATQVYVDVSCTREGDKVQEALSTIQQQIADMTGLEFKNEAQSTKAAKLKERLKGEKILIVLDDLWKEINLEDGGIPCCNKGSKIVLVSRDEDLLRKDMGAQICFPLQHLSPEEAWQLFKKTAGTDSVEGDDLLPTAREVVQECQGLPIAIVTIAKALKDESVAVWKNALNELKNSTPTSIRGVKEKVYACLEWSYNHLDGDEVKSLFLLCGSLRYGDISMQDLLMYAMGLDLFDGVNSLEETKNKLIALVRTIKASSLLLDCGAQEFHYFRREALPLLFMDGHGDDYKSVRMHDVVRDVAENIASKHPQSRFFVREYVPLEEYYSETGELPHYSVFARLQIFDLQDNSHSLNSLNSFPEWMNRLKVLDFFRRDFETLPSTIQSLANLGTLLLDKCCKLRAIDGIGELKKLRVLSMAGSNIRQLPREMAQLTDLRLLDLNDCKELEVIPRDILSSLSQLECLFMKSSFSKWAVEEVGDIACLAELNHLDYLTTIEVEILNVEMVPKEDNRFLQNLTSFAIFIGDFYLTNKRYERSKTLKFEGGDGSLLLTIGMHKLLEKIEELKLGKSNGFFRGTSKMECSNVFSPSMPVNFRNLKCLSIKRWGKEDKDGVLFGEKVSFPNLEKLKIKGFSTLKTIWHPQLSLQSLDKLQILRVYTCPCLVNLFPSHLMLNLRNLKEVIVDDCEVLEGVFGHGEPNGDNIALQNIEILKLKKLPKLRPLLHAHSNDKMRYFLSLLKFKDFHRLKELHIINCGMPLDEKASFSSNLEVLVLERFLKLNEIEFANPQKLRILSLKKLPELSSSVSYKDGNAIKRCRLSPSMSKNFHSLKHLHVIDCGMEDSRDVRTPANDIVLSNKKVSFLDGVSNYEAFESRALIFDKIMEAFKEDNIKSIGVVGIGGVGKTTMVKQVAQQAMQEELFTEHVYLDLSWTRYSDKPQQNEIHNIQHKFDPLLGGGLGMWYSDGSESAVEMKRRLKKMLIIIDDIWKEIHDLKEIGIPACVVDENECKIVLITSRDGDGEAICKKMGAQICFRVETLPQEEAWSLFKKTASSGGSDWVLEEEENNNREETLRSSIAKQVVEECKGLPIALVINARALKDETQVAVWKDALEQLRAGKKVIYSGCLRKGDDHFKSLLLLCGMLDNGDISIAQLLQYAIGLDVFDPIGPLEQARERLLELVETLKDNNHHPDPQDRHGNFVRLHHVVHDDVSEITSKDPRAFVFRDVVGLKEWAEKDESKSCTFLSLHCKAVQDQLPQTLVCPELQFFLLHNYNHTSWIPLIPDTFFQGMKKLQVLDLSIMNFELELSSSVDSLENLRTLRLNGCYNLVRIVGIGNLTKLEVLSLGNTAIRQLPDDMSQLNNLRLLDLDNCMRLEVIPRNVISSLSRLQCLSMINSFTKWAMEGDQSNAKACLSELSHLPCLTTLYIEIPDAKMLPKDIQFENLTRYAIFIRHFSWWSGRTDRTLKLQKVNISSDLGDGIRKLLERSELLEFKELRGTKHVFQYPSNGESFAELKHLQVSDCRSIEYIIDATDQQVQEHGASFPRLESLVLRKLISLQELWLGHPIPKGSFGNLKTLEVFSCWRLRYLFSLSTARGLPQIEKLEIKECGAIEQIISCEKESEDGNGGTDLVVFPNLRTLKLERLPKLISFCSQLKIGARPEDSSLISHKVSLSKLKELKLYDVPKLKDVWNPHGPFGSLPNVQILWVWPDNFFDSTQLRPKFRKRRRRI